MSPLPSTTESWDSDPDLILPDGPLTLLHSDTEGEAETSSSSVSALFSHNGNHSAYSVGGIDEDSNPTDDWQPQEKSSHSSLHSDSSSPQSDSYNLNEPLDQDAIQLTRASRRARHSNHTSRNPDSDQDDDRKGGTLTLKTGNPTSYRNLDCFSPSTTEKINSTSLLHPHHPTDERDPSGESFSSTSSSECQSTIKASFLPLPNSDAPSTSTSLHYRPSKRSTSQIDQTVLAVLASGAKGTVTRLEPSKRPSPVQAGLDWDEDIVLPEGGLQTIFRPTIHQHGDVKKKISFASAISDELEDLNVVNQPGSYRSGATSSSHTTRGPTLASQSSKSTVQCSTVNEEDGDFADDFELPPSGQSINLTDLNKKPRYSSSKPNSIASLTGSELDGLDDDPSDLPKSSTSSRRGSVLMTALPHSSANSTNPPTGNRGSTDDTTPRIRTRPSLTPSLMSDRSSSSFPEAEDDINEGFFDDIEFPPEFGIPNNLAPAPNSSTTTTTPTNTAPTSTPSAATPKSGQSSLPDPKGKQTSQGRVIDLQNYLNTKVKARALLVERNASSYLTQQLRQNISTFEDRDDERVEDGLEIETGSIHSAKLHSRKSSSFSSASSPALQSARNSYFQQFHGQKSKSKRVTVPFPSSTSTPLTSQPNDRHARFSTSENRSNPVASSSKSTPFGRPASHVSLINRPSSAVPPGSSQSRLHALTSHRPISAAGIATGLKNAAAYSSFVNPPPSDALPRFRTKSLRPSNSNTEMSHESPPASCHSGTDPSSRIQSPLGNSSRGARLVNRGSAASSLRARVSTMAASNGPPVLSASSQRTLKHKKSAAALKSVNSGLSGPPSNNSTSANDGRPPLSSPPGSNASSNGRGLHRKQSMPSLNCESQRSSVLSGLPSRLGGAAQSAMSAASIWKSNGVPHPKVRQHAYDCSSMPSSPNLISGPALPSYADPTRASMNRHVGAPAATSGMNSVLPDRSSSVNSRRSSIESARLSACSPAPPMTVSTSAGASRLTMPTIASRLKAKPSIIHEEHSSTTKRWTNGIPAVVPHQLRRPRRPRAYGDGTELDEFDDLPTSKEKEKLFTRAVKTNPNNTRNPSKLGPSAPSNPNEKKDGATAHPIVASQRSRSRLETRKAEGARRRALAINAHIKKISTKKGLIRQMSGNTLSQLNTEMRWNDQEARWEGNEHILREFDNVLSTSSRPALISQLSIQSPRLKSPTGAIREDMPDSGSFKANKAQNHVVGGMIFDAESMSWRKLGAGEEDEDELQLESDEELELRWLADDESSSRRKTIGGVRHDGWNSLSSSLSLPQHSHLRDESEDGSSQSTGKRHRGTRSDSFWLSCVEAEARHKKEIRSWIPIDEHREPLVSCTKPLKKSAHPVKAKKSNASNISSHTPSSTTSVYPSNLSHHPSAALLKFKPGSVIPGNHPHGRLTDADRCYLQEIRKLVLEEI